MQSDTPQPTTSKLLVDSRDAAQKLSISPRTLWSVTAPRGDLPCIRCGRLVRYSVDDLRDWIDRKREGVDD